MAVEIYSGAQQNTPCVPPILDRDGPRQLENFREL